MVSLYVFANAAYIHFQFVKGFSLHGVSASHGVQAGVAEREESTLLIAFVFDNLRSVEPRSPSVVVMEMTFKELVSAVVIWGGGRKSTTEPASSGCFFPHRSWVLHRYINNFSQNILPFSFEA